MKKLLVIGLFFLGWGGWAQVGINTTTPNAQLDIRSSSQATPSNKDGLLIPRIDAFPAANPTASQQGMLVYLTTTALGKPPGFYYWDNPTTSWKTVKGDADADFFEVGSVNPPDDTNDAMYHMGNVGIGKNTTTARLDVEQTSTTPYTLRLKHSNVANNSLGSLIDGDIESNQTNGFITGTTQRIEPNNNVQAVGTNTTFQGATSNMIYGSKTDFANTGSGLRYGIYNTFSSGTGSSYGLFNSFSQASTISLRGVYNGFGNTTGSGNIVGLENYFYGNGNGAVLVGVSSSFGSNTSSNMIGYNSYITSDATGTGNKYGLFSNIDPAAGGVHYGVYSLAQKSNSYAGYFLGRMAIGNSAVDTYIMPLSRGTANQIIQTDGSGNLSWQDPSTVLGGNLWSITGNSGTSSSSNFIGTTDNTDLVFRRNGVLSGRLNTTNTAFGGSSLLLNTASANTAFGVSALQQNTAGANNTAAGYNALRNNTYAGNNVALGNQALFSQSYANGSTAYDADNVAIGYKALYTNNPINSANGIKNVAVGSYALQSNTSGLHNTAVGFTALMENTVGIWNTGIGTQALMNNVNGQYNTAVGQRAMVSNISGDGNVVLGVDALRNNTAGDYNVALGYQAGMSETGSNKLYISNSSTTTPLIYGEFDNTLARINGNLRVNGPTIAGDELQLKNSNLYSHTVDGNLSFGNGGGYFMTSTMDNAVSTDTGGVYGDGNAVTIWSPGDANGGQSAALVYFVDEDSWGDNNGNPYDNNALKAYISPAGAYVQVSDQNKKEDFKRIENPLEKISQISGYTYQFKQSPEEKAKGDQPIKSSGVLAQEIIKVLPEAVQQNRSGDYFVDYAAITPLLIEALKAQQVKVEALEATQKQILVKLQQLQQK